MDSDVEQKAAELARAYRDDVAARTKVGDKRAEYHAQEPKVEALRLLLVAGLTPKAAVNAFETILRELP